MNPPRHWSLNRPPGMPGAAPRALSAAAKLNAARPPSLAATRVNKRILPYQPGATRGREPFADALLCVRNRDDPEQQQRLVTVAWVGEQRALARPAEPFVDQKMAVTLRYGELPRVAAARRAGRRWGPVARVSRMTRRQARQAGLDVLWSIKHDHPQTC